MGSLRAVRRLGLVVCGWLVLAVGLWRFAQGPASILVGYALLGAIIAGLFIAVRRRRPRAG